MKTKEKISSWNDLIFHNRNKIYGAYELRTQYHNRLSKAFIITLSVLIIILILALAARTKPILESTITSTDSLVFSDLTVTSFLQVQKTQKPSTSEIQKPDINSFLASIDTNENIKTEKASDSSVVSNDILSLNSRSGISQDTVHFTTNSGNSPVFFSMSSVELSPQYPGGMEKFYKYIRKKIQYTQAAKNAQFSSKVFIRFIIDENGSVTDINILNKAGFGIDEEIMKALTGSPKWSPGIVNHDPVKTEMILPLTFSLVQ